jgi:glycosyltransferase involved in cell wall biosynthesis
MICGLSIVIPAYNEESRLEKTLRDYIAFFYSCISDIEIIVVTDGCTDQTPQIVDNLSRQYPCIKHIHPTTRLGKGGAVIEGFKAASKEMVGFVDGDGSTAPDGLCIMLEELGNYDSVIASRWVEGANIIRQEPFIRVLASRGFNILVRVLFNLPFRDTQCGAKFFRHSVIMDIIGDLGLTDWSFDVELLYRIMEKGYTVKEIPVTWEYREGSKLNVRKVSTKMFLSVVGLRIKLSPLSSLIPGRLAYYIYKKMQ